MFLVIRYAVIKMQALVRGHKVSIKIIFFLYVICKNILIKSLPLNKNTFQLEAFYSTFGTLCTQAFNFVTESLVQNRFCFCQMNLFVILICTKMFLIFSKLNEKSVNFQDRLVYQKKLRKYAAPKIINFFKQCLVSIFFKHEICVFSFHLSWVANGYHKNII